MGALRSTFAAVLSVCGICSLLPGVAGAFATIEPPPKQSPSSELPDGRVYELVSPANKHGSEAGADVRASGSSWMLAKTSVASPDGDAVAFAGTGPAAEVNASGLSEYFVAERILGGWKSRSTTARMLRLNEITAAVDHPEFLDYSRDLSHLAYLEERGSLPGGPYRSSANLYFMGSNPLETPTWLLRSVASPSMEEYTSAGTSAGAGVSILGMTPDASVVYFSYEKHLLPKDENRAGWGIYESRLGVVSEVGVLPDGSVPNGGALPAASAASMGSGESRLLIDPDSLDNQISEDGRRLFFVAAGQLYVHELAADESERTVLVSASQIPGHTGEASADGTTLFENRTRGFEHDEFGTRGNPPTYAYASPDGSHVIFQSVDQLTAQAPADGSLKVYDFDVDTETLEYLPGVNLGGVVTSAKDGSSFLFVDGMNASPELKLWTEGPGGGNVRSLVQLPAGGFVGPGRSVAGGSVIVFQAQGPVPGIANSADEQIYRYDVRSDGLTCVSCPPAGVLRSGNAYLSVQDQYGAGLGEVNESRGVSSDGQRIFFATPDALVSRDVNGDFDTYEWENGNVFLISSGTGTNYSPFLDNSESGGDVFFATSDELVQGDTDQSFDVYDARVPRPGDNPPPQAVPCTGDVCQGPPSVVQLLGAPPSATFSGAGNLIAEPTARYPSGSTVSGRARKLAVALRVCRKRKLKSGRIACEKRERKRYAAKGAKVNRGRGK